MYLIHAAFVLAGVGAVTGETRLDESATKIFEECAASTVSVKVSAGRLDATIDAPGAQSLRCIADKLARDPFRGIEQMSCSAPDHTVDLRCELAAAGVTTNTYAKTIGKTVYGVLLAAVESGLDLERFTYSPEVIELAGEVPSKEARTKLDEAIAKTGAPARTFGIRVGTPLAPDSLPEIAKGAGPAKMHLSGLSIPAAHVFAADAGLSMVALADGDGLSGRLAAANRAGLAKALASSKPMKSVPIGTTGTGRKVTLSFQRVSTRNLVRILGDVMNQNTAVPAGLPDIAVSTKNTPSDAVQTALARLHGLERKQVGNVVFFVKKGETIRAAGAAEKRWTLDIAGANATEVLALAATGGTIPYCLPAGDPLRFTQKNAVATHIAEALRVMDGSAPVADTTICTAPLIQLTKSSDLDGLKLIGTLTGAVPTRALVRRADKSVAIVESGSPATGPTITREMLVAGPAHDRGELKLALEGDSSAAPAAIADHRVIGTLVSERGNAAVLLGRKGRVRIVVPGWTTTEGSVEIEPGVVKLRTYGYDPYGLSTQAVIAMPLRSVPK